MHYSHRIIKLALFPVLVSGLILMSGNTSISPAFQVVGTWESVEKNLQIEMFEDNGQFAGRMIYFKCSTDQIMRTSTDTENPNKELTDRKLLGLKLVTKLSYKGKNVWDNGKIYDPNSGRTFEARIQLTGPNTALVRGYWKFKWIGRTMVFNRVH